MAVSLETLVSLLGHRVSNPPCDCRWLPAFAPGTASGADACRFVPRVLVERPKAAWAYGLTLGCAARYDAKSKKLIEQRLSARGFFDAPLVRRTWREHQVGASSWKYPFGPS